jgi:hypothetical protein
VAVLGSTPLRRPLLAPPDAPQLDDHVVIEALPVSTR